MLKKFNWNILILLWNTGMGICNQGYVTAVIPIASIHREHCHAHNLNLNLNLNDYVEVPRSLVLYEVGDLR